MDVSLNLSRLFLHNRPVEPETLTALGLASYRAALDQRDPRRPISGTTFAATATKRNRSRQCGCFTHSRVGRLSTWRG